MHLQKLYIYTRKSQLYGDVLVSLEGVGVVDTLLLSNNPEGEPTFFNHLMNFELSFWWAESLLLTEGWTEVKVDIV